MPLELQEQDLSKFIVVGDRVLIKPASGKDRTASGLFLPPGVGEKEQIQSGFVYKVGPGYPIPSMEIEEPWKPSSQDGKYIPLQAREGDQAIYLQSAAHEIRFNDEKFVIVPHAAILMLIRDEELFD